jgi:hypothetical protein
MGPSELAIAIDGSGAPVVAFSELATGEKEVYARRWSGSDWEDLGSPSIGLPGLEGDCAFPAVAFDHSGRILVSFNGSGSLPGVYVRRYTGTVWETLGRLGLTSSSAGRPLHNSMAVTQCGDPVASLQPHGTT